MPFQFQAKTPWRKAACCQSASCLCTIWIFQWTFSVEGRWTQSHFVSYCICFATCGSPIALRCRLKRPRRYHWVCNTRSKRNETFLQTQQSKGNTWLPGNAWNNLSKQPFWTYTVQFQLLVRFTLRRRVNLNNKRFCRDAADSVVRVGEKKKKPGRPNSYSMWWKVARRLNKNLQWETKKNKKKTVSGVKRWLILRGRSACPWLSGQEPPQHRAVTESPSSSAHSILPWTVSVFLLCCDLMPPIDAISVFSVRTEAKGLFFLIVTCGLSERVKDLKSL